MSIIREHLTSKTITKAACKGQLNSFYKDVFLCYSELFLFVPASSTIFFPPCDLSGGFCEKVIVLSWSDHCCLKGRNILCVSDFRDPAVTSQRLATNKPADQLLGGNRHNGTTH